MPAIDEGVDPASTSSSPERGAVRWVVKKSRAAIAAASLGVTRLAIDKPTRLQPGTARITRTFVLFSLVNDGTATVFVVMVTLL